MVYCSVRPGVAEHLFLPRHWDIGWKPDASLAQPVKSAEGINLGQEEDWQALSASDPCAVEFWWAGQLEARVLSAD